VSPLSQTCAPSPLLPSCLNKFRDPHDDDGDDFVVDDVHAAAVDDDDDDDGEPLLLLLLVANCPPLPLPCCSLVTTPSGLASFQNWMRHLGGVTLIHGEW